MPRNKLKKFSELELMLNVAQESQQDCKDKLQQFLDGKEKIILELGCGKGEYTLAMAKLFPEKKYLGVDIQGERLWHGATIALKQKLNNVFFLRTQIELITDYISNNSMSEIWITFPDPFPKKSQIKKRLSFDRFLNYYKKILEKDATINIKTDDENFYFYSLKNIEKFGGKITQNIYDLYKNKPENELLKIKTYYEAKHLANKKKIHYLQAKI